MINRLNHVVIIVPEYEEALAYYVDVLGFEKHADMPLGDGFRWLTVAPKNQSDVRIVLSKATDPVEEDLIGKVRGWVFEVDDCKNACEDLVTKGVKLLETPSSYVWGTQAIIEDMYGNQFTLLQPNS